MYRNARTIGVIFLAKFLGPIGTHLKTLQGNMRVGCCCPQNKMELFLNPQL